MTADTLSSERSLMGVVLAMTVVAVGRQFQVRWTFNGVTRFAGDFLVPSRQWIFGLGRMVKAPTCPAVRIVARSAIRPETSFMPVLVAFFARNGRIFERRRLVTFLAWHSGMEAN